MATPGKVTEEYSPKLEKIGNFWNARGEVIDPTLRLFVDSERGATWRKYAEATMPREVLPVEVFTKFGLIDTEDSVEWINVVEHSMAVAATALDIAYRLKDTGVDVDIEVVERAAWVHDASKRLDVIKTLSREDEAEDDVLERVLREAGYSDAEIRAAKNTGRLPDRYIKNDDKRNQAIENRSVEENIVGYADARMRGSSLESLEDARDDSIAKKPKDAAFFSESWYPYYKSVEGYFTTLAPDVDLDALSNDTIYASVKRRLAGESKGREKHRFYVDTYTVGKGGKDADPSKNEDVFRFNKNTVALADGATGNNEVLSKRIGRAFGGLRGGRIAAEIAVREAIESDLNGVELVNQVCLKINELCADYPGITNMDEAMLATLAAARLNPETGEVIITQVGDTAVRVTFKDGTQKIFSSEKIIDTFDAKNRATAIKEALKTGMNVEDAAIHGREMVMDSLLGQGEYRNNPHHKYGFGCITAHSVPEKFVQVHRLVVDEVQTIELITDGYLYAPESELPKEVSVAAWEEHIQRVHAEDPQKYLKYLATKTTDDRTVLIARIR